MVDVSHFCYMGCHMKEAYLCKLAASIESRKVSCFFPIEAGVVVQNAVFEKCDVASQSLHAFLGKSAYMLPMVGLDLDSSVLVTARGPFATRAGRTYVSFSQIRPKMERA
jgi:hypothetical protein